MVRSFEFHCRVKFVEIITKIVYTVLYVCEESRGRLYAGIAIHNVLASQCFLSTVFNFSTGGGAVVCIVSQW